MSVTLKDTLAYIQTELVKDHVPELLQERYFPTDPMTDLFETKKVMLDFDEGDLRDGAFVKKGYVDGNTVSFISKDIEPPRSAVEDSIDPTDQDRQLFENLCGQLGGSRDDSWQALLTIKANRNKSRVARDVEKLCANCLLNNGIQGTMATSATDPTPITIDISYFDTTDGAVNPQFAYAEGVIPDMIKRGDVDGYTIPKAWGESGAKPYQDVCAMVRAVANHGGNPVDLLISSQMWSLLRADKEFKEHYELNIHQEEGKLEPHLQQGAAIRGTGEFEGYLLNIITYSRAYKDSSGANKCYLPSDFVCVLSPDCGRTLCGGTTHLNRESVNTEDIGASFTSKSGKFILSKVDDFDSNELKIRVESRPLPCPKSQWRWMTILAQTVEPDDDED